LINKPPPRGGQSKGPQVTPAVATLATLAHGTFPGACDLPRQ
jgi:hypothetical protein